MGFLLHNFSLHYYQNENCEKMPQQFLERLLSSVSKNSTSERYKKNWIFFRNSDQKDGYLCSQRCHLSNSKKKKQMNNSFFWSIFIFCRSNYFYQFLTYKYHSFSRFQLLKIGFKNRKKRKLLATAFSIEWSTEKFGILLQYFLYRSNKNCM